MFIMIIAFAALLLLSLYVYIGYDCICMCVCMYVCMYVRIYIYTYLLFFSQCVQCLHYVCIHASICTRTYTYRYTYITHIYIYIYDYRCTNFKDRNTL